MGRLSAVFAPERVAVVGATDREGSVGRAILENLDDGFVGDVIAVNPNRESVLGHECYDALVDAPPTDMAVVVVPPQVAVSVVRDAGEAGVDAVVVVTAGFGEAGGEGAARERELAAVAAEYDLDLVGPNCLGVMNTGVDMNATFGPEMALPGNVSFMSQSGAFITAVLDWANDEGIGFRDVVSLGNKAVLDETDFVDNWGADEETDVVIGYLESIKRGREFVDTAREVTKDTPVVLVKSGRTDAGAHAASSHTGAIAGSEAAYEAGLEQAGVLRADSVEELFDWARVLSDQPLPDTDGVAVVTNAGGPGVLATDAIGDADLDLASFADDTIETLSSSLPENANVYNPVDVIGDADVERFREALDAVLGDPNVGSAVVVSAPTAVLEFGDLAEEIVAAQDRHDLPVVACLMGGERSEAPADAMSEHGIPNYFDPARAVSGLDALSDYRRIREREYDDPADFDVDRERVREILTEAADRGEHRIGIEAMEILDAYGIDTPTGAVAKSPHDAEDVAREIGGPVAMKIVSPDILHKSDIGGVKVGVDEGDVHDAYEDLVTRARNYQPDANVLGVQVQELLDLDDAVETIVGVNRDPQFGPLVLFGLGGIFVEVMEDTSLRVAPVGETEAREMTEEIQSAPLLRGARGRDPVDVDAVVETIQRLAQLATDFPAILELDVNPLVVAPDGATAVDLRLTTDLEEL
ncbi:CoA-binding protein [Halorubellus sp. JP-L1]|uniref:acetate--CoA ligase family protein n=1 Tax=Halorubellus sp. JP-L1 TaxID=2715753 RepID=UPI00140C3062|nr:acetate--CoA ligase [Halorubellus sp. JP-L1]NHN40424.1 CoA-binding protein [Halorubellus sp. JP-L1]